VCTNPCDAGLGRRFASLARREKDVDAAVWPVHVSGAVFEFPSAVDAASEVVEQVV
jgi:hypothetical protein